MSSISMTPGAYRMWASLAPLLFMALTVVFGLQMLRMLMIGLAVYLRQVIEVNAILVGVIAFGLFLTAFLAPLVLRTMGYRGALVVTAGGLGLTRAAEQFVSSVPVDLVLSMIGVVLFLWFMPLYIQGPQRDRVQMRGFWAIAFLLGISADTAIKGVFGTVDLSWEKGAASDILVTVLVIAQWLLLLWLSREEPDEHLHSSILRSLPLLAIGPVLVLELLLFQNIGQQTVLINWPQPAVYTWILMANLAGIIAAVALVWWNRPIPWPPQVALGALLILMVVDEQSGILAAFIVLVGQIAIALILVSIARHLASSERQQLPVGAAIATGVGMLLLLILIFAYYSSYDIDLLVPRQALLPLGAGVVALSAIWVARTVEKKPSTLPPHWVAVFPALLLLILPLVHVLSWDKPAGDGGRGFPVRVMSYNLHQGFDVKGCLGLEALAQVIEEEDADIVALQEVSRGWLINDSVDMLVWFSQRLGLSYVWGPATDSVWGNAILSRYPITKTEVHSMPNNEDIRINRGFITVEVNVGGGAVLTVITTHLHAGTEEGIHRIPQVEAILEFLGDPDTAVLLGDLNAHPDDDEMVILGRKLKDAFGDSNATPPGYTSRSDDPWQRIDYIWISPDLDATNFSIAESLASDHFGIAATLNR